MHNTRGNRVGLGRARCLRIVTAVVTAVAATLSWALPASAAPAGCTSGATLTIVAHEDDDLLFRNPDIGREISSGRCIETLYVTAGDANSGPTYWQSREA